jgi:benzylsuccinate CoA-transferase BbsF subunit
MPSALEGYRVVDFTRHQAGPVSTVLLADMGMEIIKVESGKRRDAQRMLPAQPPGYEPADCGTQFAVYNRGKKSISLDVSRPKGLELAKALIRISDAVVENFATGVMKRLGLDYESIRKVKPDIVMVSLSGFGETGPHKDYVAFAKPIQAYTGLIEITGNAGGPPGEPAAAIGDNILGTYAAFALLSALFHREQTGEGQYIDLSMAESIICNLPETVMAYTMNGSLGARNGNRDEIMAPHNVYRCGGGEDSWVAIAVAGEDEWKALLAVMEKPHLELNRFDDEDDVDSMIQEWTLKHTKHEVMERLQKAGVPAFPVMDTLDLLNDPHLKERQYLVDIDQPGVAEWVFSSTWKMSDTPGRIQGPPPLEGQDNDYVYSELLGLDDDEIAGLVKEKIIF